MRVYQGLNIDLLLQDGFRVAEQVTNNPGYKTAALAGSDTETNTLNIKEPRYPLSGQAKLDVNRASSSW